MIPEYLLRALLGGVMVSVLLGMLSPLITMKGLAFLTHATFHSLLFGAILGMILGLIFGNLSLITWVALIITIFVVILIALLENRGFSSDTAIGVIASFIAGFTVLAFGILYKVMANKPYFALSQSIVSYLTGELFLITETTSTLALGSKADKGSSKRRSRGFETSALASNTLCFCPPLSSANLLFFRSPRPANSKASSASFKIDFGILK